MQWESETIGQLPISIKAWHRPDPVFRLRLSAEAKGKDCEGRVDECHAADDSRNV